MSLLLALTASVELVARDPLYSQRIQPRIPQQPVATANLCVTTLASSQAPFTPVIWPPVTRQVVIQDATSRNPNVTVFFVPDVNAPREPYYTARNRAPTPQQPYYQALNETTLASTARPFVPIDVPMVRARPWAQPDLPQSPILIGVVAGTPVIPPTVVTQPARGVARQPIYSANQQTTVFVTPDTNEARQPYFVPRILPLSRQQPTYVNLPPAAVSNLYFLNDSGFSATYKLVAPQQPLYNTLPLLSAAVATLPPKSQDLHIRVIQRFQPQDTVFNNPIPTDIFYFLNDSSLSVQSVPRPNRVDYINGTLQLLSFTPPELPENFYDWQLPKTAPRAPFDTSQGQNPALIPPPIIVTPPDENCGGWERHHHPHHSFHHDFELHRKRRHKHREDDEQRKEAVKELPPVEREIAKLLHEQESRESEANYLRDMQQIADQYAGTRQKVPRNIAATLLKAQEERSRNALEQLERELNMLFEEEEMALMLILLADD